MPCNDECFKIDMGCECYPAPPTTPRPYMFIWYAENTGHDTEAIINFTAVAGAITGYSITTPGDGYTVAPTITIGGAGTGATATCTINSLGQITSVTVTAGGSGYGTGTVTSTITDAPTNALTLSDGVNYKPLGLAFKEYPLFRISGPPPVGGGVTLTTAKIQLIANYCVYTNGVTNFTGTWYVNGVAQTGAITIDSSSEVYTPVTHYSGEITFNTGDYVTYQLSSTESKLITLYWFQGAFTVKYT